VAVLLDYFISVEILISFLSPLVLDKTFSIKCENVKNVTEAPCAVMLFFRVWRLTQPNIYAALSLRLAGLARAVEMSQGQT
jgi:hypothetical protein